MVELGFQVRRVRLKKKKLKVKLILEILIDTNKKINKLLYCICHTQSNIKFYFNSNFFIPNLIYSIAKSTLIQAHLKFDLDVLL